MRDEIKRVNPAVSFDLWHHNLYWAKRYFAMTHGNPGVVGSFSVEYLVGFSTLHPMIYGSISSSTSSSSTISGKTTSS
jgi:hypothetical protein